MAIASVKGFPAFGVFSASKAAVRSFARTWLLELKERRIPVKILWRRTGIELGVQNDDGSKRLATRREHRIHSIGRKKQPPPFKATVENQ
jgi:NAD(P)-dependent dehydrogenase (short-subunit alcohol dehydrogenase family)